MELELVALRATDVETDADVDDEVLICLPNVGAPVLLPVLVRLAMVLVLLLLKISSNTNTAQNHSLDYETYLLT